MRHPGDIFSTLEVGTAMDTVRIGTRVFRLFGGVQTLTRILTARTRALELPVWQLTKVLGIIFAL